MQVDPRGLPGLGAERQPERVQHLQGVCDVQRVRALLRQSAYLQRGSVADSAKLNLLSTPDPLHETGMKSSGS